MTSGNTNTFTARDLTVTLAVAALGYFRWTQLVPMLVAWSILAIMLGAFVLANFQEQTFSVLARADDLYSRYLAAEPDPEGAAERPAAPAEPPPGASGGPVGSATSTAGPAGDSAAGAPSSGALTFDGEDLEAWVWRVWAVAALVGWLLGSLWRQLFGVSEPWLLRRKLLICGVLAGACSIAFFGIWQFSSERYHGSAFGWVALFVGVPSGVWLVSAWSLSISHLLGRLADHIDGADRERAAVS